MRRARITYPGAFHHAMNRGHDGSDIFNGNRNKSQFLDYLAEAKTKMKIKIFAYCVMDTHYHLVLENSSGKMSEFMKRLNGHYGSYYRTVSGGKGYVFQGRFKSTLIAKDAYLLQSIAYLLRNPVRAGLVVNAQDYTWSSIDAYYSNSSHDIVDADFVNELFESKEQLMAAIHSGASGELQVRITRYGEVLGSEDFFKSALKKFDRRTRPQDQSIGDQRRDDFYFEPVEKVIWEFEKTKGLKMEEIDIKTLEGKRQRAYLLVLLKEKSGLTYKEIRELDIFADLRNDSLRGIYRNMNMKMKIKSIGD
jgi:REP element-mobilizing transposase RayT